MRTISWEQAQAAARPAGDSLPGPRVLVPWAGLTVGLFVLGGVLAGLLWSRVAEPPVAVVERAGIFTYGPELARAFGVDVAFAWTASLPGLVIGPLAGLLARRHGWAQVAAVAVGGLACGVIAWQAGQAWGPAPLAEQGVSARVGDLLVAPVDLGALGLLAMPAVVGLLGLCVPVLLHDRRTRRETRRRGGSHLREEPPD